MVRGKHIYNIPYSFFRSCTYDCTASLYLLYSCLDIYNR